MGVSIVLEKLVISAVTWEIKTKVRNALQGVMLPFGCPQSLLFVPEKLQSDVISWSLF